MKTIDKFTLRSFLGPLLASFFIIMFVLMMNAVWRFIDDLVGKGLGLGTIAELIFYQRKRWCICVHNCNR